MRKRIHTTTVSSSYLFAAIFTAAIGSGVLLNAQESDSPTTDAVDSIVLVAPENDQPTTAADEGSIEDAIPSDDVVQADANSPDESQADVGADDIFAASDSEPTEVVDETNSDASDSNATAPADLPQPPAAPIDASATAEVAGDVNVPEGVEPLLRGPVHEAFAEPLQLNVAASPVVPKAPPEPVEELPPEINADENAIWISGYWAWDEDRSDFIWVSGVWRKQPNGRTWTPGSWVEVDNGVQWVAGFWTNAVNTNKVQVIPKPPETLEQGPTVAQPSDDHFWIPGSWKYRNSRYAWRPGFWSPCQQDWVWVPEHYTWRPNGCVHVAGYWDYHWNNRGTLFAPTYFSNNAFRTAGYRYQPSVVVSLGSAFDHLWIRPGYNHYFIGDYYSNYNQRGYIPWYSYSSRTRYYDPLFAYQRWALRNSIHDLHHHYHQRHDHYNRHVGHRPFHTYRDYHIHRGRSRVSVNPARRAAQVAPPSRLTGSAFVSRVDEIVRQQHRDRHGRNRNLTNTNRNVTSNRQNGNRGNAARVNRGNANRTNTGNRTGNGRNVAATGNGVRSVTNKPINPVTKVKPGQNRPNVGRPQVRPNQTIVQNNNQNNSNKSGPNVRGQRPQPSKTKAPTARQLVTKPRKTSAPIVNPRTTNPQVVTKPNNSRRNVSKPNPTVTNRPRVTRPNPRNVVVNQNNVKRPSVNQPRVNSSPNVRRTTPSRTSNSVVRNSPQVNRNTPRRQAQPQRVQPRPQVQTPRQNTNSRAQQFSRTRQQSNVTRPQARPQQSRTQSFRPPVSRPKTVTQPSIRNVRPNVRSTPQRTFSAPQRTPQRSVTPRRSTPQRSFQQPRSTPQRTIRSTPRPSSNSNRGAGFNRSRASTPRPSSSRGNALRGKR